MLIAADDLSSLAEHLMEAEPLVGVLDLKT